VSLRLQRCQRQQPLGDQSRSLSLVNCFGPAQIYLYVSVWLVPMLMVSSAICSPSPSGTNPAPFCETLGEIHQHFYARLVWLCCNHCVILVSSGARYCSSSIYYSYILMASSGDLYYRAYNTTQGQPIWLAHFHCGR